MILKPIRLFVLLTFAASWSAAGWYPGGEVELEEIAKPAARAPQAKVLEGTSAMPLYLDSTSASSWVSADHANLPLAQPTEKALLPPALVRFLEQLEDEPRPSEESGESCVAVYSPEEFFPEERGELAEALRSADSVLWSVVTGTSPGFLGTTPGTMLRLRVVGSLKGPERSEASRMLFLPAGKVSLGDGLEICVEDHDYPVELPSPGDEALLFIQAWGDPQISVGGSTGFVLATAEGRVLLPRKYRESNPALEGAEKSDLAEFHSHLSGSSR